MNPLAFLNPLNAAADTATKLVDLWLKLDDRKKRETASMIADLDDLLEQLRKTHSTIVKLVSPLRRIQDDPVTFKDDFTAVYNDFRDFYDAYDFLDERTHCHKITQVRGRIQKRKPRFGSDAEWNELDKTLDDLTNWDIGVIDDQFKPFMESFDATMNSIKRSVDTFDTAGAIVEKNAFLQGLGSEYDRNKAKLEQMTDAIGTLEAGL